MKLRLAAFAAASMFGAAAFAGTGIAGPEYKNQYPNQPDVMDCGDDGADGGSSDTITWDGPDKLWPPNHKMQQIPIEAVTDDGDEVTLRVSGDVTDAVGGDGGSNHDPDVTYNPFIVEEDNSVVGFDDNGDDEPTPGQALVDLGLRGERSGRSGPDGERVYTIDITATFDGDECTWQKFVTVPHDMSKAEDREGRTNGGGND